VTDNVLHALFTADNNGSRSVCQTVQHFGRSPTPHTPASLRRCRTRLHTRVFLFPRFSRCPGEDTRTLFTKPLVVASAFYPDRSAAATKTMDRLRSMSGARRLFNGPLNKTCSGSPSCRAPAYRRASPLPRGQCAATALRLFGTSGSHSSGQIGLESPFGPADPVDVTLPEYIWKNVDKWGDKPMIVSASHAFTEVLANAVVRSSRRRNSGGRGFPGGGDFSDPRIKKPPPQNIKKKVLDA